MATTKKLIQASAGVSSSDGGGGSGGSSGSTTLDISGVSYASKSYDVSSEATFPSFIDFNAAGTKMIIADYSARTFFTYSLSTAWDVTTASYDGSSSSLVLATGLGNPLVSCFGDDGRKLYSGDHNNAKLHQHTLSTAYDVSTASSDSKSLHVFSVNEKLRGPAFSADGTKLYVAGAKYDLYGDRPTVNQWDLTTAWDISTASFANKSLNVESEADGGSGNDSFDFGSIHFNSSGTQLFFQDAKGNALYQYDLTTAWDISTASYASKTFDLSNETAYPRGLAFDPDATKMYTVGNTNDTVYQYDTNGTWTLSSGGGSGSGGPNVQDVFSVSAYTGTGSTQTITNDVDLSSGGMVWSKRNSQNTNHYFTDTERGGTNYYDFMAGGQETGGSISSFNSDGYSLASSGNGNVNTVDFTSYSFKDQDHFFKQFEFTGNGTTQEIAHGLGSVPGLIFIKQNGGHWIYWNSEFLGTSKWGYANLNTAPGTSVNYFGNNTTQVNPTSTHFTVGNSGSVNSNGTTYTVYVWGNNSSGSGGFGSSGSEDIIKCGGYVGNGTSGAGPTIDLGFEPQFFLIRCMDYATGWFLFDSERGMTSAASTNDPYFEVKAIAQNTSSDIVKLTSSGIQITGSGHPNWNQNNVNYFYMAIRKTMPTGSSGSGNVQDFFSTAEYTGNGTSAASTQDISTGVDLSSGDGIVLSKRVDGNAYWYVTDTVRGGVKEYPIDSGAESSGGLITSFNSDGYTLTGFGNTNTNAHEYLSYTFKKQDHFFNCFEYTGNGVAGREIDHGLSSTPGLIMVKRSGYHWGYWHKAFTGTSKGGYFNLSTAPGANLNWFNDGTNVVDPTSTSFTVGSSGQVNGNGGTYLCYVFADNINGAGGFGNGSEDVIKCGTYTGTGTTDGPEIDLGFQPQLFFFKNITSASNWHVFDAERGLTDAVGTNDPYLKFDNLGAEITNQNVVRLIDDGIKIVGSNHDNWNATNKEYAYVAVRADM